MPYKTIFLGIDIGTSGCKVVAIDENAALLADATSPYPLEMPQPGWTQQHPADWWTGAQQATKAVVAQINPTQIRAVGITGQMHGMVALNAANEVIRPAILWNDQRTAQQVEAIVEMVGGAAGTVEATNNPCLTGFTVGKLLWLKENEPENYAKIAMVVNPKDYIRYLLTGEIYSDVSGASGTGYYDVEHRIWATDYLKAIGLRAIKTALPPVLESTAIAGKITAEAARATGIPVGIPVVAGGGDAVLSSVAMGISGSERLAVTLGTSGVLAQHVPNFSKNVGGKLQFSRACLPGQFHKMGVTLSAAGSYAWFAEAFGDKSLPSNGARYKALDAAAAQSAIGANGVLFLPYLQGERCPLNDSDARGAFIGIGAQTTLGDFARAVLEGVSFSLRHVYQVMAGNAESEPAPTELVLAGGGAASPLWRQITADVFGLPVAILEAGEAGSSYGAAILAGLGTKTWTTPEEILARLPVAVRVEPNTEAHALYNERFAAYLHASDKRIV
jgi:xylulokinase